MSVADYVCWIDLETSGLDPTTDRIMEVGFVVTRGGQPPAESGPPWAYLASGSFLVGPRMYPNDLDPVVAEMHAASGLLDAFAAGPAGHQATLPWIESYVFGALAHAGMTPGDVVAFGGSGVDRFDRRFAERDLPALAARMTYWAYDESALRRAWQAFGRQVPERPAWLVAHRALPDALWSWAAWCWHYDTAAGLGADPPSHRAALDLARWAIGDG